MPRLQIGLKRVTNKQQRPYNGEAFMFSASGICDCQTSLLFVRLLLVILFGVTSCKVSSGKIPNRIDGCDNIKIYLLMNLLPVRQPYRAEFLCIENPVKTAY